MPEEIKAKLQKGEIGSKIDDNVQGRIQEGHWGQMTPLSGLNILYQLAVKPAVQLLQIQEVHPLSLSSACNFCRFSSIFLTCSV